MWECGLLRIHHSILFLVYARFLGKTCFQIEEGPRDQKADQSSFNRKAGISPIHWSIYPLAIVSVFSAVEAEVLTPCLPSLRHCDFGRFLEMGMVTQRDPTRRKANG